jgi:hypothetical protein
MTTSLCEGLEESEVCVSLVYFLHAKNSRIFNLQIYVDFFVEYS